MKYLFLPFFLFLASSIKLTGQIISQYVETDSGTTPKGIEIWNNTQSILDFSTNNLIIEKGVNGGTPSSDFTLSSGTLAIGEVLVIGTTDIGTYLSNEGLGVSFHDKSFQFNGDDALVVKYGGTITDVFGDPGNDPGTNWSGNGVSTRNQNIQLLDGITTGDTDGWTDPSTRFETVSTNPSGNGGLVGFGVPPVELVCNEPTSQPTNASVSNISYNSSDIQWNEGDGQYTLVLASENSPVDENPVNENSYNSNAAFGDGDELENGNFVVYAGSEESFTLSGLEGGTTYYLALFSYNCTSGNEQYLVAAPETAQFKTLPASVSNLNINCVDNSSATISWNEPNGNYDGVVIGVRQDDNSPHSLSVSPSVINADATFGNGYQYGSTLPYSYVVYKGN